MLHKELRTYIASRGYVRDTYVCQLDADEFLSDSDCAHAVAWLLRVEIDSNCNLATAGQLTAPATAQMR